MPHQDVSVTNNSVPPDVLHPAFSEYQDFQIRLNPDKQQERQIRNPYTASSLLLRPPKGSYLYVVEVATLTLPR